MRRQERSISSVARRHALRERLQNRVLPPVVVIFTFASGVLVSSDTSERNILKQAAQEGWQQCSDIMKSWLAQRKSANEVPFCVPMIIDEGRFAVAFAIKGGALSPDGSFVQFAPGKSKSLEIEVTTVKATSYFTLQYGPSNSTARQNEGLAASMHDQSWGVGVRRMWDYLPYLANPLRLHQIRFMLGQILATTGTYTQTLDFEYKPQPIIPPYRVPFPPLWGP